MNTNKIKAQTVEVKLDDSIIQKLRHSFTSFDCVFKEAMQNARRANATVVKFDSSDDRIKISDNGDGFSSLQDFLTLSGSGWSNEVIKREGAFGMGSFSMIYASSWIKVASNGQYFEGYTDDILNGMPLSIDSCDTKGTEITLIYKDVANESDDDLFITINKLSFGFSIDVIVNDRPCEHLHRYLADNYLAMDVGFGRLLAMNIPTDNCGYWLNDGTIDMNVYYQGLPVSGPSRHARLHHSNVIHLDETMFDIRMPDRDVLIDAKQQHELILNSLKKVWRIHLQEMKALNTAHDFATLFYKKLAKWNSLDLLNDVPVVPEEVLFYVVEEPFCERMHHDECFTEGVTSHRDDLAKVINIGSFVNEENVDKWLYAYHAKALCISDGRLDAGHWLYQEKQIIDEFDVKIESNNHRAEIQFNGDWVWAPCQFSETVTIDGPVGSVELSEGIIFDGTTFYIPSKAKMGNAILQASAFTKNDECDETAAVREEAIFEAFLVKHNGSTTEALKSALDNPFITALGINSQTFELTFSAEGIEVKEIEVAA